MPLPSSNTGARTVETSVSAAMMELRRRFLQGGGCQARGDDFAAVCPSFSRDAVVEALHQLAERGEIDIQFLTSGEAVFCFPSS